MTTEEQTNERISLDLDAVKQLQRAIAAIDISRDILVAGLPAYIATKHYGGIDAVVSAKATMVEMQNEILARLPEKSREWVMQGSRIGADHLRGR